MVRYWNKLLRESADAATTEVFKARLDEIPGQLDLVGGIPVHSRGLELYDL